MKIIQPLFVFFLLTMCVSTDAQDFLSLQKKYSRVRETLTEKESVITKNLKSHKLSTDNLNILIVAYKAEKQLEIYAKGKNEITYKLIAKYDICQTSGTLGPKRKKGDLQIPEGFYQISSLNPVSNFYLSLKINYPNASDRIKSTEKELGGDIMIHGGCDTVGCIPMTDNYIKEIYLYAVYAKNCAQSMIPIYIFPYKMTNKNISTYSKQYSSNQELIQFWNNLKIGYDHFFKYFEPLQIKILNNGDYSLKE